MVTNKSLLALLKIYLNGTLQLVKKRVIIYLAREKKSQILKMEEFTMRNFTISKSNLRQEARNTMFQEQSLVTEADVLKEVCRFDHVGAVLRDGHRSNKDFVFSNVVIMDCDNEDDNPETWVTPEKVAEDLPGVEFAVVPSRHNMLPKGDKEPRPKFHVYFPIRDCADIEAYVRLKAELLRRCPYFDSNARDAARMIFGVENPEVTVYNEGEWSLTVDDYINSNPLEPASDSTAEHVTASLPVFGDSFFIPEGQRNTTVFKKAISTYVRYGISDEATRIILSFAERCEPPLEESELATIIVSAKGYAEVIIKSDSYIPPEVYSRLKGEYEPDDYTDVGEAKVFVEVFGNIIRYSPETRYIVYNGVYWEESEEQARIFAQQLTDLQMQDADSLINFWQSELEEAGARAVLNEKLTTREIASLLTAKQKFIYGQYQRAAQYKAFVLKRRGTWTINAVLKEAAPHLTIAVGTLDSETYLLNTPAGTYDLREGTDRVYPHKAEDYITKVTAVSPSDEGMELWEDMLDVVFCGDKDLKRYVQQLAGFAALGGVFAENLIIAHGESRNGKSTLFNVIARVLGSYSGSLSADVLTNSCRRNIKPELAELRGKRLVIASELEEGNGLNTAVLKHLCSTDPIYAEPKFRRPFSFIPTHLAVLCTNHLPSISTMDTGTWRRIKIIPFNAVINGDSEVKNYTEHLLKNAGGAILKWVIEGAYIVIENDYKIEVPEAVKSAVEEYRATNNDFQEFLDSCCKVCDGCSIPSGELYTAYRSYAMAQGSFAKNKQDFYSNLERAGFSKHRTSRGVIVMGLTLKTEPAPYYPPRPELPEGMEVPVV